MKMLVSTFGALAVLVTLWPATCVSSEEGGNALGALGVGASAAVGAGPTSCQSAVFLDLPWGDSADTWGIAAALAAATVTFVLLWLLVTVVQRRQDPGRR